MNVILYSLFANSGLTCIFTGYIIGEKNIYGDLKNHDGLTNTFMVTSSFRGEIPIAFNTNKPVLGNAYTQN